MEVEPYNLSQSFVYSILFFLKACHIYNQRKEVSELLANHLRNLFYYVWWMLRLCVNVECLII